LNLLSQLGLPGPEALGNLAAPFALAAAAGYLIGAIPFGYLVARSRGVNIFEEGSRNPGATNVRRVLGPGAGYTVYALDALKGAAAAALPLWCLGWVDGAGAARDLPSPVFVAKFLGVAGLVAALLGHSFSCFTRFRGGKGVATASGGFLLLMPQAALASALLWVILFYATRYVSLASIVASASLPVAARLSGQIRFLVLMAAVVACFVILRHRGKIARLLNGTENRFGAKKPGLP